MSSVREATVMTGEEGRRLRNIIRINTDNIMNFTICWSNSVKRKTVQFYSNDSVKILSWGKSSGKHLHTFFGKTTPNIATFTFLPYRNDLTVSRKFRGPYNIIFFGKTIFRGQWVKSKCTSSHSCSPSISPVSSVREAAVKTTPGAGEEVGRRLRNIIRINTDNIINFANLLSNSVTKKKLFKYIYHLWFG